MTYYISYSIKQAGKTVAGGGRTSKGTGCLKPFQTLLAKRGKNKSIHQR